MNFKDQMIALGACIESIELIGNRSLVDCHETWWHPGDMAWLVRRVCHESTWRQMLDKIMDIPWVIECVADTHLVADAVCDSHTEINIVEAACAASTAASYAAEHAGCSDLCCVIRACVSVDVLEKDIEETIEREKNNA